MSNQLLLVLKNNNNKFGYKSDVIADIIFNDEKLGSKLLASFGLSYNVDIKNQTLKTARCINHVITGNTVTIKNEDDLDLETLLDKKLLKSYIKENQQFLFTDKTERTPTVKLQTP